jgi:WhiB family redox-sensing transcriptional regulator
VRRDDEAAEATTDASLRLLQRPGWQRLAACRGHNPNLFFPSRGASLREAKLVCAGCVVRADCLEFALASFEKRGVWGGYSERERRGMRATRRLERKAG